MSPITIKPSFYLGGTQPEVTYFYGKKHFNCSSKIAVGSKCKDAASPAFIYMMPFLVHLVLSIAPCAPVNHEAFVLNICTWQSSRLHKWSKDNNHPECAHCVVLDVHTYGLHSITAQNIPEVAWIMAQMPLLMADTKWSQLSFSRYCMWLILFMPPPPHPSTWRPPHVSSQCLLCMYLHCVHVHCLCSSLCACGRQSYEFLTYIHFLTQAT